MTKDADMIRLVIHAERCKNCGLCVAACPQGNLVVSDATNEIGYHPVGQCDEEKCTGCGLCAVMCPDLCFSIYRVKEGAKQSG
jgi:2-oxoglutarate ferredoxin oxidoreductase subunit delta